LGRDGLPDGTALVIAPSNAVHTFFMRFAIDVIFCVIETAVGCCGQVAAGDRLELAANPLQTELSSTDAGTYPS
jgi:ethanolamine transporter EutH